jgi:hypothetical protein
MRLRKIDNPWKNARSWAYLLGGVIYWSAALGILRAPDGTLQSRILLVPCPLKSLTGIPCPFCGLTSGSVWFAHGQWLEAWRSNLLSPIFMMSAALAASYTLILRVFAGCALDMELESRTRFFLWSIFGILILVSWLTNIWRS